MTEDVEFEIASLLSKFKNKRISGDLDAAQEFLEQARSLIAQSSITSVRTVSMFHYEDAYFDRMKGMYIDAARKFRESGLGLGQEDNGIRLLVGEYMAFLTEFYGDVAGALETFERHQKLNANYGRITGVKQIDGGFFKSFEFSTMKTLADLAFEVGHATFPRLSAACRGHDFMLAPRVGSQTAIYRLFDCQLKARKGIYGGGYADAIRMFESYLTIGSMTEREEVFRTSDDGEFLRFVDRWPQEMAREYRDFGRSIIRLGGEGAKERASRIFAQGLELPDGSSNLRFKNEIRADLQALESAE